MEKVALLWSAPGGT